ENRWYFNDWISQLKFKFRLGEIPNVYSSATPLPEENPTAKSWSRSTKFDLRSASMPIGWFSNNKKVIMFLKNPFITRSLLLAFNETLLNARSLLLNCNEPFRFCTGKLLSPYKKLR